MKNIVAHHFMRNFKTFEEMREWLEKYRVYAFYEPHVKGCWRAMQEHKLIKREHELDYELVVQKMKPNSKREIKLRLNIYRKIREMPEIFCECQPPQITGAMVRCGRCNLLVRA